MKHSSDERERMAYWHRSVTRDHTCAMCTAAAPIVAPELLIDLTVIQAHHILEQSRLRRLGVAHCAIWDRANGIALCRFHHARHHTFTERLPRALLSQDVVEYATEHGVDWLLDKEYPYETA